jgi:O-antigen/teichoic acid export membrane protein
VVIVLLGQVDKLMVSAILPLRIFGFYMLANTIAQSLNLLPAPIVDAMFPRFSQLVAQDNVGELARLFNKSCQLLFGLVLPMAAVLAFYAHDVLWLWTKDPLIAQQASKIATVLIIGVALNTVMSTMDTLLMAFGWMKPAFYSRLAALLGITPVMWFLCHRYGALGAASAWLIVFAGYLCVTPFFVFSKILPQEKTAWYVNWLRALLITFVTAGICFYAFPHAGTRSILFIEILLVTLGVFLVNAICTPTYRNLLRAALP